MQERIDPQIARIFAEDSLPYVTPRCSKEKTHRFPSVSAMYARTFAGPPLRIRSRARFSVISGLIVPTA